MKKSIKIWGITIILTIIASTISYYSFKAHRRNLIIEYIKNNRINKLYNQKYQNPSLLKEKLKGDMNITDYILKKYSTEKNIKFILEMSIEFNNLTELKKILKKYPKLVNNTKLLDTETLLHMAASASRNRHTEAADLKLLTYLLENGADPNIQTEYGPTPLHTAAYLNNIQMIKLLIKYKAKTNIQNSFGMSPLHVATRHNKNLDALKLLLEHGAEINALDKKNQTPLDMAYIHKESTLSAIEAYYRLVAYQKSFTFTENDAKNMRKHADDLIQFLKDFGAKTGNELQIVNGVGEQQVPVDDKHSAKRIKSQ